MAVNLARLPDGKNFGITITQSPLEGVRILGLVHKHEVLEVNDRIVQVNGINVTGLSVKEVAECVRRRRQDKILSLVVEKPRSGWGIGRFFSRSEQRQEESLQRYIFGGSYPRTLHLTVIGAIGLPALYPSSRCAPLDALAPIALSYPTFCTCRRDLPLPCLGRSRVVVKPQLSGRDPPSLLMSFVGTPTATWK